MKQFEETFSFISCVDWNPRMVETNQYNTSVYMDEYISISKADLVLNGCVTLSSKLIHMSHGPCMSSIKEVTKYLVVN